MPAFRINILSPSSGLNKAKKWSTCIGFEERRLRERELFIQKENGKGIGPRGSLQEG
jgi:hypothetical protein